MTLGLNSYQPTDVFKMKRPKLPPILTSKEYKSLSDRYNKQDEKAVQFCYKPYRTLHNY